MIKKIDSAQTVPKLVVSHRDRKAAGGLEKVPPTRIPAIGYGGIDSALRADSRPASCCLRSSTLKYLCSRLLSDKGLYPVAASDMESRHFTE